MTEGLTNPYTVRKRAPHDQVVMEEFNEILAAHQEEVLVGLLWSLFSAAPLRLTYFLRLLSH